MRRFAIILALLCVSLFAVACAGKYQVTTYDGRVYDVRGEPEYDHETESYEFEVKGGDEVTVPRKDVKEIKEID